MSQALFDAHALEDKYGIKPSHWPDRVRPFYFLLPGKGELTMIRNRKISPGSASEKERTSRWKPKDYSLSAAR